MELILNLSMKALLLRLDLQPRERESATTFFSVRGKRRLREFPDGLDLHFLRERKMD